MLEKPEGSTAFVWSLGGEVDAGAAGGEARITTTPTRVDVEGSVEDFVAGLKNSSGGEIGIFSSISLVHQLLFAGLLDTLMLIVHPVVAGSGRRLFNDGDPLTRLELQSSQQTSKGNMVLRYGVRGD